MSLDFHEIPVYGGAEDIPDYIPEGSVCGDCWQLRSLKGTCACL